MRQIDQSKKTLEKTNILLRKTKVTKRYSGLNLKSDLNYFLSDFQNESNLKRFDNNLGFSNEDFRLVRNKF